MPMVSKRSVQDWDASVMEFVPTEVHNSFPSTAFSFMFELLYPQIIHKKDFHFQTVKQHRA